MKYAIVVLTALLIGLGSASSVAAQERGDRGGSSNDDDARVIVRGDDGDRRDGGRAETGRTRGRGGDEDVDRRRDRTGDERGDDVERRRSGRTIGDIITGRRSDDRRERDRRDRRRRGDDDWDDDWDDWDDDDYREGRRNKRNGNGPAFCRSGAGHPVHGRQWCREKGYDVGGYDDGYWERGRTRDIYFPSRRRSDTVGGSVLEDILGGVVIGRIDRRARDLNRQGPLRGRWKGDDELRLYVGDFPIARFVDTNSDRSADYVYLRR